MAKAVRPRRIVVAASALSLALVAPLVTVPEAGFLPVAAAVTAGDFGARYNTDNFWRKNEAAVQGLALEPGDIVQPTTNTIFNWTFRNDNGTLYLIRPRSSTAFKTGNVDIPVRVTPANGAAFNTSLRVNVVDVNTDPAPSSAPAPVDREKFNQRYTTENFWNANEAKIQQLSLDPNTRVEPTTNTIFNWGFRNDGGTLVLRRPQSGTAFKTGPVDIAVRVTEPGRSAYTTTLRVNVVDEEIPPVWAADLPSFTPRKTVDFEKSQSKAVDDWTVPAGVTVVKRQGFDNIGTVGWDVAVENGTIVIKAPATFSSGDEKDIPVTFSKGAETYNRTLPIKALNPKTDGKDVAGAAGNVIGGLLGGLTGGGGGLVRVEVHPSAVNITGNGSNNGNPNVIITNNANPSVAITNNANPTVQVDIRDNGSNNTVQVTGNANPTVQVDIRDNGSNNSATVSGNGVVQPSAVVVTGNVNPVVTGNANNNGSNNSANVTGNGVVQPSAVIATGNGSNNASNNSAVVTGNANPNVTGNGVIHPSAVVATGNGSNNGSGNHVAGNGVVYPGAVSGNGIVQPSAVSGNGVVESGAVQASGSVFPGRSRSQGKDGDGVNAATGGLSDPRCIASLAALGIPLAAMIPLALAQTLNLPALDNSAAIAAGAFNDIVAQFGIAPAEITAIGGGIVGVALAATVFAAAMTCSPKVAPVEVPVITTTPLGEPTA